MKSFFITLVLCAAMLCAVTINFLYINRVASEMNRMLAEQPDIGQIGCMAHAEQILNYWEEHLSTVGLSVGYTVADRISEQSTTLLACAECGDLYGFRTALALLKDAVSDMARLEKFSVHNLF